MEGNKTDGSRCVESEYTARVKMLTVKPETFTPWPVSFDVT